MQTRSIGLRWWVGIAVGLFAAVFILGAWLDGRPTETDGGRPIAVPTAPAVVPAADGSSECPMAAFGGRLVSHPAWGIAVRNGGTTTPMLWPHGYVGRVMGRELQLLNADGQVIGRAGDWIDLGGGEARVGNVNGFGVCPVGIHVKPAWP